MPEASLPSAPDEAPAPPAGGSVAEPLGNNPGEVPEPPFEIMVERPAPGLLRRFLTTQKHLLGLGLGFLIASVRERPKARRRGLGWRLLALIAFFARPWVRKDLRQAPFPVQLRRRLEILGPTYIKLGQVLSLRRDLLPDAITDELKNLLDRLPVVPFERYVQLVAEGIPCPLEEAFSWVDPRPLGSASIAQTHRATTVEGEAVILKVVKPGIRETLLRDAVLLKLLGSVLQWVIPSYRPRQVIQEFVDYTSKEIDLRREADNAETFAANFRDQPDIVFPQIYRQYSGINVLCMEFLDGHKPTSAEAQALPAEQRDQVVDLGACAIIRMLYQDGFFHADLHPGNLLILPGPKAGFIDLGMVGRFDDDLRRTLLYYYYCLVMGDPDNAARFLAAVATTGPGSDPVGFRRALTEISQRWHRRSAHHGISLAQLVMYSVNLGGQYKMYFPVEMVLMVKALVTFEGVGYILQPELDIVSLSQKHVNRIFLRQFSPFGLVRQSLRGAPELVDAVVKAPMLITEGLRLLEQLTRKPTENPLAGVRGTLFGGFSLVAGAVLLTSDAPWAIPVSVLLFVIGFLVPLRRGGG